MTITIGSDIVNAFEVSKIKYWHLVSMLKMPIYKKRKVFNPLKAKRKGLTHKLYSWLCKIQSMDGSVIHDKIINIRYELNTDIGRDLYYQGEFESYDLNFIRDNVLKTVDKPVILDIGANIGLHSIYFVRHSSEALVYAFEPSAHTRKILVENISLNKFVNQIVVSGQAVSDRKGVATFFQTDDNAYSSLKDTKRRKVIHSYPVELTTLDSFVQEKNLLKIDFIKIDVEGFEREVINGGLGILKKFMPDVFIEIYKGTNSNLNPELTIKSLTDIGYRAFVLDKGRLTCYKEHSDQFYNYYFTMK